MMTAQNGIGDMLAGILLTAAGVILFIYRHQIGSFTGYYTGRGGYVDKPTPGCLLIPFAVALLIGGIALIARNI